MNKTILDSVGSTDSAGIEEDEAKQSVIQSLKDKIKPTGKKLLKEAVKAATSQGGVVGGLIADRLLDTSGERATQICFRKIVRFNGGKERGRPRVTFDPHHFRR